MPCRSPPLQQPMPETPAAAHPKPSPPTGAGLRLAGHDIEYKIFKPSSAVQQASRLRIVLLHEGLGCVALWRQFPQALADRLAEPVMAYSRYGYGQSEVLDSARTVRFMHEEADRPLRELRDHFALEAPILIGHSDGASIALLHAGLFPDTVHAVVALAPHLFVEEFGLQSIRQARHDFEHTDLPTRLARYHRDARRTFEGWCDIWLSDAFKAWNIEREVACITCPVLAIQGIDDQYGTLAQIERIAQRVRSTQLLTLETCRHSPHLEQGSLTLDAIARFVETQSRGAR